MKGLRIVLIIIGISLSRCGVKSDDGPKAEPVEVKYYKESETQQLSNQASVDLGVLVMLEDNKDFRNEYKYKYVLSLLKKYRADIIKIQTDIEKIVIGSQTAIRDNKGKSVVYVNLGITDLEMSQLFKEGVTKFKNTYQLLNELSGRISLKVVDQIGINATNVAMIKDKLTQLGKEINFSQDSSFTEIELGEYFALTGSGMVININSSMGEILSMVKDGLEMRLKWQQETAPLISAEFPNSVPVNFLDVVPLFFC